MSEAKNIRFEADKIITAVPTCCLIEDYWILALAKKQLDEGNWKDALENIGCAMECIQESIDRFTMIQKDLDINPSVYSAIAMSEESGIILVNDKHDLRCLAGKPLSDANNCACPYCEYYVRNGGTCDPDEGKVMLLGNVEYNMLDVDSEEFMCELEDKYPI